MSYIGNNPEVNAFTIKLETFNGTGACTQFLLTRDVDDSRTIEVVVNGVIQTPVFSYTVTNGLITFDEAPSLGVDNISVRYLAPVAIDFRPLLTAGSITETTLATGSVTTPKIATGAVTTIKILDDSVTEAKIATGSITTSKIATGAITTEKISDANVTEAKIATGSITTSKIANNSITSEKISTPPDIFDDVFLFGGM